MIVTIANSVTVSRIMLTAFLGIFVLAAILCDIGNMISDIKAAIIKGSSIMPVSLIIAQIENIINRGIINDLLLLRLEFVEITALLKYFAERKKINKNTLFGLKKDLDNIPYR